MKADAVGRTAEAGTAGRNLVQAADHNLRITLEAIRRGGPLARSDLARLTGLSEPGVGNILKQLLAGGLVAKAGRAGRAAGFGLAENAAFGLGIDLPGERAATAVVVDLRGRVRLRRRFDVEDRREVEELRDAVLACIGTERDRLAGCGVALGEGVSLSAMPCLEPLLAASPETFILRDTDAASLGELHFGMPEDGSFATVFIDRTVRAGFVIEGRLFRGVRGRAGRLGRMHVDGDGSPLDAVAGAGAMPGFPFAEAAPGILDAGWRAWLDRAALPLMDAVVAVAGFLGPAAVFVGGRLPEAVLAAIADRLNEERARRVGHPEQPFWLPWIAPATLAEDGAAMGAAAATFFSRLLPDPRR
ncbi:ROK family transcriptional regulator [Aureimonas leprariae]|uniref:ROK family transcriptional regulator n=1 Tax=Plantimonas leprariae TaxID=2615207 RepID=A0A7V7TX13_9HYPH|nr:ROK family transcriptional regulator [Aureimonas leprariae]KAB0680249.1 ROK family transcriptional regulator [Aureimonas leprariae]